MTPLARRSVRGDEREVAAGASFMTIDFFDSRFKGLDLWDDADILAAIIDGQEGAVRAVRGALPGIAAATAAAAPRLKDGRGRLVYAGAGTPARLAVLDGVELTPTYGWPVGRLAFLVAGGERALVASVEEAEDDAAAAARDVAGLPGGVTADDVMIAVSASGRTPYTLEACRRAKAGGALTVGLSSVRGSPLLLACDRPVFLDSGPEPVGGSTRMNAGTAQKAALNAISTLLMIRLGRVYDGYMVDVAPANAKLRGRALAMLREIAGCGEVEAARALDKAGGHVKLAVLLLRGLTPDDARARLHRTGGDLRRALSELGAVGSS